MLKDCPILSQEKINLPTPSKDSSTGDAKESGDAMAKKGKALAEALKKFASAMSGAKGDDITAAKLAEDEAITKKLAETEKQNDEAADFAKAQAMQASMSDGGRSAALNSGGGDGQESQYIVTPPLKSNLEADPFQVSRFNPFAISQPSMLHTANLK